MQPPTSIQPFTNFAYTSTSSIDPTSTLDDPSTDVQLDIKENDYILLLVLPFIIIPALVIGFRMLKYVYKFIKARHLGERSSIQELGLDPIQELGLTLFNNQDKLRKLKKIKKEHKLIKQWKARNAIGKDDITDNQKLPEFLKAIQKTTRDTWTERLSPEAVRRIFSSTQFGRLWMIFQVSCTAIAIVNYIILTYAIDNADRKTVKRLDVALAFVFMSDYLVSFYTAEDRLKFYFKFGSLVDMLSIIPPVIYFLMPESEEKRELTILALSFINFLFLSASIINAFESLQTNIREIPSLQTWHDSLYYIIVTFSTIGFGDLTPTTVPSRVMVMCLIILVVIIVPLQSAKILELYNSTTPYQRAAFTSSPTRAHVIITGLITPSSIIDFCREYYANDPFGSLVILSSVSPTLEIRRLLRHPYYKNRVHYLAGSAMVLGDLKRCCAGSATGIFLLNGEVGKGVAGEGEQIQVTRGADAAVLMQALVVKTAYPGLPIFAEVQDIRSQDLARACGCNRTICIDELKMGLIARNALFPGILTYIMNLVHTYPSDDDNSDESWKKEYSGGASNQVYSFKFPSGFIGVSFVDACVVLFQTFNVTLFGVFENQTKLLLNPARGYIIREDDVAVCMATGGDDTILRICIQFTEAQSVKSEIPPEILFEVTAEKIKPQEVFVKVAESNSTIQNHIILCGASMTARGIRHFIKTIRKTSVIPICCLIESPPLVYEEIWQDILAQTHVTVVKGTPLKKTDLLASGIESCACIVIFQNATDTLVDSNSIFQIQMIKEDFPKTRFIVELVNGSNTKFFYMRDQNNDLANVKMEQVLSDYAINIADRIAKYQQIRTDHSSKSLIGTLYTFISSKQTAKKHAYEEVDAPKEQVASEILSKMESEADLNDTGLSPFPLFHFDRHFASGMVTTTSFIHSLICQSYFRPYILNLVTELSQNLVCIPVESEWAGKTYGEVFVKIVERGMSPMGLYRKGGSWKKQHDVHGNSSQECTRLNAPVRMPYVYTNCLAMDVVSIDDLVFVIE